MLRNLRSKPVFQGWRFGILLNVVCTSVVLGINLGVTIWALSTDGVTDSDNRRRLHEGDCDYVKKVNTAGHVVINVLSTALLAASNYSMQCLSAPSRTEVDDAHRRRTWLDIGTPSLRNLASIPRRRRVLWLLLGISSLPLHLFYNSALFSSLGAVEYNVLRETEDFLKPGPVPLLTPSSLPVAELARQQAVRDDLHQKALSGRLERLDNLDCLNAYVKDFQGTRSNVVLMVERNGKAWVPVPDLIPGHYQFDSGDGALQAFDAWVCADLQRADGRRSSFCATYLPELRANASAWTSGGSRIRYCLSERVANVVCVLYFSPAIAGVVIAMNLVKAVAMALVLVAIPIRRQDAPLLILGDAIASFVDEPDKTTAALGLVGRGDFRSRLSAKDAWRELPQPFDDARKRRFYTTGRRRIGVFLTLYLALLALFAVGLGMGLERMEGGTKWSQIWQHGVGAVAAATLITGGPRPGVVMAVVLANVPQLLLSGVYVLCNGLLTSMATAEEWERFATDRKGLRVSSSSPRGRHQRASHLLQLPYRFALPLMAASALLHWLASQSIFLADVDVDSSARDMDPARPAVHHFPTCGYSPLAIFWLVVLGAALTLPLGVYSLRRLRTGMPVAGNCSAAISAACHGIDAKAEPGASERPLQWGEVLVNDGNGTVVRRCAFSDQDVSTPVRGTVYPEVLKASPF